MGGGGGRYFNGDLGSIMKDVEKAQKETAAKELDSAASNLLNSYLSDFNDRDTDALGRHIDEIRSALGKEIEGSVDLRFGGSVAKHTYVDGLSDVDTLVFLDNCELADHPPGEAKDYIVQRLKERFPSTSITVGRLAITIEFSDIVVQLLPAVSCRGNVKIADESGSRWAEIRPREFSAIFTSTNQQNGGKVVPVVKLAKAIISTMPEKQRISGYHAESLAVEAFRDYKGSLNTKDMLRHFFEVSSARVLNPIVDRTGQSVHVDDYLGWAGSLERKVVADAFSRTVRRMKNADAAGSLEGWRNLFGE